MKNSFKGINVSAKSDDWVKKTSGASWLSYNIILHSSTNEHLVKTYSHPEYVACEYMQRINIFSFGRFKLDIPFTVIAPPVSVDETGFVGDINALVSDYKHRNGLFLLLNLKTESIDVKSKVAFGKTLPSCIFKNDFDNFKDYLSALRSSYRRRIKNALKKGEALRIERIKNANFDESLYKLYLQVLAKSDFPLEKLPIKFFQNCGCDIHVFYYNNTPVAFIMYERAEDSLKFIFGGMDYAKRDQFDIYYNMLLQLVKVGIDTGARWINFGQTAESTKCRIGCFLENRYMMAFGGNKLLTSLLCLFAPLLQNNTKITQHNVFKN